MQIILERLDSAIRNRAHKMKHRLASLGEISNPGPPIFTVDFLSGCSSRK